MKRNRDWKKARSPREKHCRSRMMLAVMLLLSLALIGCGGNGAGSGDGAGEAADQEQGLFTHPDYEELKLTGWQPMEGYAENLLYADSSTAVLALAKEKTKAKSVWEASAGGLPNPTEYLVVYDQKTGDEKTYALEGDTIASAAAPYRDGLLFMAYSRASEDPEADLYDWTLYYAEGEKLQCLDQSTQGTSVPSEICMVDETPVYVFESATLETAKGSKPYRVMAVDGLQVRTIWEEADCQLERSVVSGDGRYAFGFQKTGKHYLQIGDLKGRVKTIPAAEHHLREFALTPDYFLYTTGWDEEDKVLHSFDLASWQEQTASLDLGFYKLIGGEQEKLLGNNENGIASVDPKTLEIRQLYDPEDLTGAIHVLVSDSLHEPEAVLSTSKGFYLIR